MQRFGWSRLWTALVVGAAMVGTTALSWAGPLLPDFPSVWTVGQAVAGQTTLTNPAGTSTLEIDWIVAFLGNVGPGNAPVWGYYYQIENDTGTTVSAFTVRTPGPPFVGAGFLSLADLDANFTDPFFGLTISGHVSGNYPNLGSPPTPAETENATSGVGAAGKSDPFTFDIAPTDVTWSWLPPAELASGYESTILYAYALVPPMYGSAGAVNATTWDSDNPGGQLLPVPSPEPSAAALLMMGLVGGVLLYRRRSLTG